MNSINYSLNVNINMQSCAYIYDYFNSISLMAIEPNLIEIPHKYTV